MAVIPIKTLKRYLILIISTLFTFFLILVQVDYAFSNNNLENLYHPAPSEVWKEFYECQDQIEDKIKVNSVFQDKKSIETFVPPWIIAKTCFAEKGNIA